ncbi:hypothetical protein FQZ97_1106020 [compost metagenome]
MPPMTAASCASLANSVALDRSMLAEIIRAMLLRDSMAEMPTFCSACSRVSSCSREYPALRPTTSITMPSSP